MADLWSDIIQDALYEIEAYNSAATLASGISAADGNLATRKLNRILDEWSGRKVYAWSDSFTAYTLTPNHSPHLIGPGLTSPDFAAPYRPVSIDPDGASLILTDVTPNVDLPLNVRDADWWNNERVKNLATNVPTDLYYEPDFPNGSLYLWPVPSFAYGLRLRLRSVLLAITSANWADSFTAPPGYNRAAVLTLAEDLCTAFGRPVPPELPGKAMRARAIVGINNQKSPRTSSADYGTRGTSGSRPDFNYYSGGPA